MQDPGITYRFMERLMEVVGDGADDGQQQAASDDAPTEERSEQQQHQPPMASSWSVTCSMVEVYNDEIRDLLAKEPASGSGSTLEIRRDAEGGLVVRPSVGGLDRPLTNWLGHPSIVLAG